MILTTTGSAWRNVRALRRRFGGLIVLLTLGLGICLSILTVSQAVRVSTRLDGAEGVGLRTIQLTSYPDRADLKRLTTDNLESVRSLPGVAGVEPTVQASFGIKTAAIPGALLYGHLAQPSALPPLLGRTRAVVFPLGPGEVVLPARSAGFDLGILLGKQVPVQFQRTTGPGTGTSASSVVTVVGLSDPKYQVDGPDSAYVNPQQLISWAAARENVPASQVAALRGYDTARVVAERSTDVSPLLARLQGMDFAASSLQQQLHSMPAVLKLLDESARVLLLLLICVVALSTATLGAALVRQRTQEIGIMKAIGFSDARVFGLMSLELVMVALGGCLLGLALSVPGSLAVAAGTRRLTSGSELIPAGLIEPPPLLLVASGCALILAVLLGALPPLIRAARLEPGAALRDW